MQHNKQTPGLRRWRVVSLLRLESGIALFLGFLYHPEFELEKVGLRAAGGFGTLPVSLVESLAALI